VFFHETTSDRASTPCCSIWLTNITNKHQILIIQNRIDRKSVNDCILTYDKMRCQRGSYRLLSQGDFSINVNPANGMESRFQ
jgi:hypothetical protein